MLEYLGDLLPPAGIQMFGTDISDAALAKCRAGAYPDSIAQDVSTLVAGDRVHLSQVLINLVINAMDAVEGLESARRRIVLLARTNPEGWIEIGVADAGPGVAAEAMKKIFDAFFTTKASGMGMGLAISRTIIEAHNGRLWEENNPENGATFWFAIPAHDQQA